VLGWLIVAERNRWQFLFLVRLAFTKKISSRLTPKCQIEAIPTIIMAFMILLFLPSFPFSAAFLTPRERAIAQARLNRDQKPQSHGGMSGWKGVIAIISDLHAWLFALLYASCKSSRSIPRFAVLCVIQSTLVLPQSLISCLR